MRNVQALMREWCAKTNYPQSDMFGRVRSARENKPPLIQQKATGRHSPPATEQDAAVMILAPLVASRWKDVPAGILRYGALPGEMMNINEAFDLRFGQESCRALETEFRGKTLLEAVKRILVSCRHWSDMRVLSLRVERSDYRPMAFLTLGDDLAEAMISFVEPDSPREGIQLEPVVGSDRIQGFALTAMADLLADNFRITHENGPSVSPDEPLPSDTTSRGANPETTGSHLEAKRERDKSQAGFESYGDASDGSPLSNRGSTDDYRPRRYG
jgi:hypothetical protein